MRYNISIHALAKRATQLLILVQCQTWISIHALAKRATSVKIFLCRSYGISIHALAKRATIIFGLYFIKKDYFNPRPRKEGDVWAYAWCRLGSEFQSTPSQRGRLTLTCTDWELLQISIHALAKRATTCIKRHIKKISLFQSTPSQRGRHSSKHCSNDFFDISIHALAKRATYTRYGIRREMTDFNPRPRKEGDCTAYNTLCCIILFQSTPSQRGRRLKLSCDSIKLSISIHALAKRATSASIAALSPFAISIHALAKRATPKNGKGCKWYIFQSTPSQRGRRQRMLLLKHFLVFQSTPSQRGRHVTKRLQNKKIYFNPRPRKEGDLCCD